MKYRGVRLLWSFTLVHKPVSLYSTPQEIYSYIALYCGLVLGNFIHIISPDTLVALGIRTIAHMAVKEPSHE